MGCGVSNSGIHNFSMWQKNKTRIKFTTKALLVVTNSIKNFSLTKVKSSKEGVRTQGGSTRRFNFLFEKSKNLKSIFSVRKRIHVSCFKLIKS